MNRESGRGVRTLVAVAGSLLLLALAGCVETSIDVRLNADGSGVRTVEMVWREGTLEDLELDDAEVRELLGLREDRGWEVRHEARPVGDGKLEPHVVYSRSVPIASIDEWPRGAHDLAMGVHTAHPERIEQHAAVEVGRGAGYRTVAYRERLDGASIRDLLDRMAADDLTERISARRPALDDAQRAGIRGLLLGHLGYHDVWSLDDEIADGAWDAFADAAAPQLARLIDGDFEPASLQELLAADDINDWLEGQLPGVTLIATMNLKVQVVVPGVVVETNADRVGEGYTAWERPAWDTITGPIEFTVRSRIED